LNLVVAAASVACAALGTQAHCQPVEVLVAENGSSVAAEAVEVAIPSADEDAAQHLRARAIIPALTPVVVEILTELSSKTSEKGDTFRLRLAEPVMLDGVEVLPAGTPGLGEVIHAKKNGGAGAAGELVLAARYLEVGDARLPLRSLKFDAMARNRMGTVEALTIASAAVAPVASFLGFLIKGDQLSLASGSILTAKTAADFAIGIAAAGEDPPGEAPLEAAADVGGAVVEATTASAGATDTISATGERDQ
jgi:hypothetical protein